MNKFSSILFTLLPLLFAPCANAALSRTVGDFNYVPPTGRHSLTAGLFKVDQEEDLRYSGFSFNKSETESSLLAAQYTYGITDLIAVGALVAQSLSNESKTNWGPASTLDGQSSKGRSNGTYDPRFQLNFRLLKQETATMDLDVRLEYSPKAFDAKFASDDTDGTVARGGDSKGVEVVLARWLDTVQIGGTISKIWLGDRSLKSPDGNRYTLRGGDTLTFSGVLFFRAGDFLLGGSLGFTQAEALSQSGPTSIDIGRGSTRILRLEGKYVLSSAQVFTLGYRNEQSDDRDVKITGGILKQSSKTTGLEFSYAVAF